MILPRRRGLTSTGLIGEILSHCSNVGPGLTLSGQQAAVGVQEVVLGVRQGGDAIARLRGDACVRTGSHLAAGTSCVGRRGEVHALGLGLHSGSPLEGS